MIRNFNDRDMKNVISLWNKCMPHNQINEREFIKSILLDINFNPLGFFIYEEEGEIKGFIYSTVRKVPIDSNNDLDEDKGWIVAISVDKDTFYIAPKLIEKAEEYINKDNLRSIIACSYTPNYFYQGINTKYDDYIKLFNDAGYTIDGTNCSMKIDLTRYTTPDFVPPLKEKLINENFTFKKLSYEYITSYLTFQRPSWAHRFRRLLNENMDFNQINVAIYNNEVIGCNIFGDPYSEKERFGPFGVRDDFQGKGIGKILLDDCLTEMKRRGLTYAWMQSASSEEHVINLYKKFGFYVTGEYIKFIKQKGC